MAYSTETEVRNTIGISSTTFLTSAQITQAIAEADNQIDKETNQANAGAFSASTNAVTERQDSPPPDAIGDLSNTVLFTYFPLTKITTIITYDKDGDVVDTYTGDTLNDTDDFWVYSAEGKVVLKSAANFTSGVPKGTGLNYTYGWASVPTEVKKLSRLLASQICLTLTMSGSYNFPATVGLDGANLTFGVPYMNLKTALTSIEAQIEEQWKIVGKWRFSAHSASAGEYSGGQASFSD